MSVSGDQAGRMEAALGGLGSSVRRWEATWGEDMPDSHITNCLHTAAVEAHRIRSTLP